MGRHQSAQNARRFSPRRRPAERNRCPSCRRAHSRGEPLLWPEVVGAARSSRRAEKPCLRCEGVSGLRPGSVLDHGTFRSIQPAVDAVAGAENPSQERSIHEDARVHTWRQQRSRQVVASHSAIPAARSSPGRRRVRQQERDWRGQHVRRVVAGPLRRRSRGREERQCRASLHRDEPVSSQHAGLAPSGCQLTFLGTLVYSS